MSRLYRGAPHSILNTLFFRLLLSFLVIMLLTGAVGIFITTAFHNLFFERLQTDMEHKRTDILARMAEHFGETAEQIYRCGGEQAYREYIAHLRENVDIDITLLRPDGNEITGKTLVPELSEYARKVQTYNSTVIEQDRENFIVAVPLSQNFTVISVHQKKARNQGDGPFDPAPHPPPKLWDSPEFHFIGFPFLPFHTYADILRAVIVFLFVALICFFLARTQTRPIRDMQRISRRIAAGDYTARIGTSADRAGNELRELGHDFDNMAEKTEQVIQAQKRLLRDISHELRSPLARLNVALEITRKEYPETATKTLDRIETESLRLNGLIEELLELTRREAGDSAKENETFNLTEVLENIAEDVTFEFKNEGKGVKVDAPASVSFYGNRRLLYRACENIVRNGAKYTAEKSNVRVQMQEQDDGIKIKITDSGSGVPEEALTKIFDPFYRVSTARERRSGGTGLGLAIAREAILRHGGDVAAANRTDTRGLEITIVLPKEQMITT